MKDSHRADDRATPPANAIQKVAFTVEDDDGLTDSIRYGALAACQRFAGLVLTPDLRLEVAEVVNAIVSDRVGPPTPPRIEVISGEDRTLILRVVPDA